MEEPSVKPSATRPLTLTTEGLLLLIVTRLEISMVATEVTPSRLTVPYAVKYAVSKLQPMRRSCVRVAFSE